MDKNIPTQGFILRVGILENNACSNGITDNYYRSKPPSAYYAILQQLNYRNILL